MKLGVPWHIKGVHPNARVSAREAARRAGMSVGEWLNSVILESSEDAEDDSDGEEAYEPPPPPRSRYARQRDDMRYQPRRETRYEAPRYEAPRYEPSYPPRGYSRHEEEARFENDPMAEEVAAIHDRLEGLTAGIEHLTRSATSARSNDASEQDQTARRLAEVVAKLDQRVEHMVNEGRNATRAIERRVENVDRALSSLTQPISSQPVFDPPPFVQAPPVTAGWSSPMDQAMAEINLRQRELEGDTSAAHARAMPSRQNAPQPGFAPRSFAPQAAPQPQYAPPAFDRQQFANVEDKLRYITEQMDTLGPSRMHDAIASLRNDLTDVARTLSEASPRRAIEALETEVRMLTAKLDTRGRSGVSGAALATMEKGLAEVRDALRELTPAENLAGAVAAIHALSGKIDQMASGHGQDPASMQQLEAAIGGLRSIVSHAASNESLSALTTEVRALAQRIDAGPAAARGDDVLKSLESRISTIADAIESVRAAGGRGAPDIDGMVRTLGDKIESLRGAPNDNTALSQLDQRIAHLVQKLDASESRLGNLDAIERGMKELLGYLAEVRSNATPARAPQPNVEHDVRRTEQSLEQVRDTIGDVVDRLAMIETGMRAPAAAPATPPAAPAPQPRPQPQAAPPQRAAAPQPAPMPAAAPFSPPPQQPPRQSPLPSYAQPGAAASGQAQVYASQVQSPQVQQAAPPPRQVAAAELRPAADGTLPYDFPLEPGSGKPRQGMAQPLPGVSNAVAAFRSSPAERIAASKAALAPPPPPAAAHMPAAAPLAPEAGEGEPRSNFILAARRAAQFAAETQTTAATADFKHAPEIEGAPVSLLGRLRKHTKSILVGASVLILLAAAIHMAVNFLGFGESAPEAPKPQSQLAAPKKLSQLAPPSAQTLAPGSVGELPQPPDPFGIAGNQPQFTSNFPTSAPQIAAPKTIQVPERVASVAPIAAQSAPEVTGSVPHKLVPPPSGLFATVPGVRASVLPPAIGGRNLLAAAEHGDPAAAYEVAMRYSEGRGVSTNLQEAAVWFERAARGGVTPAIFRLGGLYEKGIGVKKDLGRARKLYIAAAERGSAKAMHNLAVLYAEGGDAKPDYASAVQWFTKAAARGVADSQFNLGVLYARGIGLEQNMAESYKWFSLAAQSGDRDATQKRDEIGKRLDAQALADTRAALQNWKQEGQPDEAVSVSVPAGGWDQGAAAQPATTDKSKAQRAQNGAPAPRAKAI